jgi:putative oxidoreductase
MDLDAFSKIFYGYIGINYKIYAESSVLGKISDIFVDTPIFKTKNNIIMNAVLGLGKYLFAVPFAIFGIFHFMSLDAMASFAPGGSISVIISGVGLIAAALSMLIGKLDKLAAVLLALMLILFVAFIHAKGAMAGDQNATAALLKDIMLAGASLMYAGSMAKDNAVIG